MRMQPQQDSSPAVEAFGAAASFERLSVGDLVDHSKFGQGKVIQVLTPGPKELYQIEFVSGEKRVFDPKFAKLVKLS